MKVKGSETEEMGIGQRCQSGQLHALGQLIDSVKLANGWSDPDLVANARGSGYELTKSKYLSLPQRAATYLDQGGFSEGVGSSFWV